MSLLLPYGSGETKSMSWKELYCVVHLHESCGSETTEEIVCDPEAALAFEHAVKNVLPGTPAEMNRLNASSKAKVNGVVIFVE